MGTIRPVVFKVTPPTPPEPIVLPANTIRVKFSSGYTPSMGNTRTLVDADENIWDIYKSSNNWSDLFVYKYDLLEVLGANTSNVTQMGGMFYYCSSLTSVPLFDTYNVTNMSYMFDNCISLTHVPLFDTYNVTNMNYMFNECTNVEGGALALYQQASSQTTPPSSHNSTFKNCGKYTQTGAAELSQIPSDWK